MSPTVLCKTRLFWALNVLSETPHRQLAHERDGFLAFRGTRGSMDVLHDLRFGRVPFHGAGVHAGFLDLYRSVEEEIMDKRPHTLIGYSLGASLAVLHALESEVERGHSVEAVYCLAPPRVGDAAFRDLYNARLGERTVRFENVRDAVVRLPPALGYEHAGAHRVRFSFGRGLVEAHSLERYGEHALQARWPRRRKRT